MAKVEHDSAAAPCSLLAVIESDVDERSSNLPEDVIVAEILPRLHVQALFTFRCVSKKYKLIISQPEFGRSYMQRAYKTSAELSGLLASKMTMVFPFMDLSPFRDIFNMDVKDLSETIHSSWSGGEQDKEDDELGVSVNSIGWLPYCNGQKLLASSNGLILSRLEEFPNGYTSGIPPRFGLCVSNPLTKQCVKIPDPRPLLHHSFVYTLAGKKSAAAAFLTYKVVAFSNWREARVAIFSSDTGCWATWKSFLPDHDGGLPDLSKGGFAYKGVLHWLDGGDGTVLTYDPYNSPDRFDRFPLPNGKCRNSGLIYSGEEEMLKYCEVVHGCPRGGFDRVSVWRLVAERWRFEGEFRVPSLGSSRGHFFLVAPNPWNREVLCHPYVGFWFAVMNPRSGTSKRVRLFKEDAAPDHFCSGSFWQCPLLSVQLSPWSSPIYAQPN